jgi:hypothetical protein
MNIGLTARNMIVYLAQRYAIRTIIMTIRRLFFTIYHKTVVFSPK